MKIDKQTTVYIPAPAHHATGGPELLHQLAHALIGLGINAVMYYIPNEHPDPVHPAYVGYAVPFAREIVDDPDNVLIVPEVSAKFLDGFLQIQKVLWWLSVDNYYCYDNHGRFRVQKKKINDFLNRFGFFNPLFFDSKLKTIDLHLVQSYYAKAFLERRGIRNIAYLSDYLNDDFLSIETPPEMKEDIVAYNPSKGYEFTKQIIAYDETLTFVPIQNMTREEVVQLLQRAKVYIDFGNHPGKDRIPREAAMLNCCVITGRKGAANYPEDLPIQEQYKFFDQQENLPGIVDMIRRCVEDFESEVKNFAGYKNKITNEKNVFMTDVKKIFVHAETTD